MIKLLKVNIFTVQPLEGEQYPYHHPGKLYYYYYYRGDANERVTVENPVSIAYEATKVVRFIDNAFPVNRSLENDPNEVSRISQ